MTQSYIYTYPFSLRFFSHANYRRILGRVLCAIQQVPDDQSFHIFQCAYAIPKSPVHLSHILPVPFGNHTFFKICESISVLQISSFASLLNFLFFLGLYPWHMEVPRLGLESELQLLACATAKAMPDPSHVCDLHHSSQQHRILNPLSEARDRTHSSWLLVDLFPLHHHGNSLTNIFLQILLYRLSLPYLNTLLLCVLNALTSVLLN